MIQIQWQGQKLHVLRIVLGVAASTSRFGDAVRRVASVRELPVVDDAVNPMAGDFWIGELPEKGWQGADWKQIGWARWSEGPLALAHLQASNEPAELAEQPLVVGGW
jgi:hypothetical protein